MKLFYYSAALAILIFWFVWGAPINFTNPWAAVLSVAGFIVCCGFVATNAFKALSSGLTTRGSRALAAAILGVAQMLLALVLKSLLS